MKSVNTLVPDIYGTLDGKLQVTPEEVKDLGDSLAETITKSLNDEGKPNVLRMSNFGTKCDRQLWYRINTPEDAEPFPAKTRLRMLIGHLYEDIVLFLAGKAGHKVEGRQTELEVEGVKGHRDAVIDGLLVDVKSANARSFDKFKYHQVEKDDPFGYLDQLGLYLEASKEDEAVTIKGEHAFLAANTQDGSLVLDRYRKKQRDWQAEVHSKKEILASPTPPDRGFDPVADGASGNLKLCVTCAYCPFKRVCHPSLRVFRYSNGPRYLVRVVREPDVEEIT